MEIINILENIQIFLAFLVGFACSILIVVICISKTIKEWRDETNIKLKKLSDCIQEYKKHLPELQEWDDSY